MYSLSTLIKFDIRDDYKNLLIMSFVKAVLIKAVI
jgi:hypothetical protein